MAHLIHLPRYITKFLSVIARLNPVYSHIKLGLVGKLISVGEGEELIEGANLKDFCF